MDDSEQMIANLTTMISTHLYVSQFTQIKTASIEATYLKENVSLINSMQTIQNSQINIPSFCDLINSNENCSNRVVTQKSILMAMALTGSNGDTNANIGLSKSFSFSVYDEKNEEIKVSDLAEPVEFWISKDDSEPIEEFQLVNALNATHVNTTLTMINGFIVNGFKLNGTNSSVHIQIKPVDKSSTYLTLLKFGDNPTMQINSKNYDLLNIFCPNDLKNELNDSFYLIFANMSLINGYKGYVGFSIIEMNATELNCQNKSGNSVETLVDLIQNRTSINNNTFTDNYWLRIYLSGCYYFNTQTNEWSTDGVEILSDTNITHTHCEARHLTTFAGGFIVLPPAINFNHVWANASFAQNPIIYSTVIFLICLYVLLAIWSRYMDSKDGQKVGITLLGDVNSREENVYMYEIMVFTGMRFNAGTKSNVSCIITSESTESDIIKLKSTKRLLFQRGGVDSFIFLNKK